ncbi:uncharacterized protein LOC107425689 isoform X2 [Ziziphus jujuba]|uniref:Uncharacterized protein LOC107425689 isoform X2 n=1 Tax=Ziziphus jujuba TaxID=326968 RepID=A0ABM3ITK0_ZIZJJ|nr:uncharacterized protein LOC107425689 isoform X2 [Ziziphus jujuba]
MELKRTPFGSPFLPTSSSSSSSSSSLAFASVSNKYKFLTVMGRSKKPQSPSPSSSPKGSEPTPPRITSNVKQNLQFLKLWKEFQKRKSSTPKPATSYRRKKAEKEDLPEDTEIYRDPTTTLYYTNQGLDNAVPVLLVDGYNVCGYWVKLKKHFTNGRLDVARQKLINELVTFSMLREVKVVVVFDAMMSGLPTHKEEFDGSMRICMVAAVTFFSDQSICILPSLACVDIVYSGESCADAWIEKEVVALREDGCPRVWVVTSDRIQQHAAHGAIKESKKEVERMLLEHRSTSFQGKLLKHNLDSEVVDALRDLRKKLAETESR